MNWLLKEMEECGADGVDFVPVFGSGTVYATYSKAEILDMINRHFICVPKSSRRYWKGTKDKKNFIPVEETPGVYEVTDSSLIGSAMANGNWSGVHQACVARENRFLTLVHVDISGFERRRIHAALYSSEGEFGVLNTDTPLQMVEQLCARWKPGIAFVIDPRGCGIWYIDELMKREVKVVPPKSTNIASWLPKTDRR